MTTDIGKEAKEPATGVATASAKGEDNAVGKEGKANTQNTANAVEEGLYRSITDIMISCYDPAEICVYDEPQEKANDSPVSNHNEDGKPAVGGQPDDGKPEAVVEAASSTTASTVTAAEGAVTDTAAAASDAATAAAAGREIVIVTVEKKEGGKLGFSIAEGEDKLVVTKVKEDGLVAGTELCPGMELFSINSIEVAGKSSSDCKAMLVGANGVLTIVAFKGEAEKTTGDHALLAAAAGRDIVTVTIEKKEGAMLGLTLARGMNGELMVSRVKEGGLVAGTELAPGMEIFSINDVYVAGKSVSDAARILVEADGALTIVAFKGEVEETGTGEEEETGDSASLAAADGREVVTITVQKEKGAKLGFGLSRGEDGKLVVTKVMEGGLVDGTELALGMEIYTINGIKVAGKSPSEAGGMLAEANGSLTIAAFKEKVTMSVNEEDAREDAKSSE